MKVKCLKCGGMKDARARRCRRCFRKGYSGNLSILRNKENYMRRKRLGI